MPITRIKKKDITKIHQKYSRQVNRRRYHIHAKLDKYFKERDIEVRIDRGNGRIELPHNLIDEWKNKKFPNAINEYFFELKNRFNYSIQLVII